MFFGKLFGKNKKDKDAQLSSRNILVIGLQYSEKKSLFNAFCGEGEPVKCPYYVESKVEFMRKEFAVSSGKTVMLNVWGITGKEMLRKVLDPYCNGAHGIILYYDPTNEASFNNIKSFVEKNNKMLSMLKVPIRIVSFTENKKGDKSVVPKKKLKQIEKDVGANVVNCCLEDPESVNGVFMDLVNEAIKRYNSWLCSGDGSVEMPPKPSGPPPRPQPEQQSPPETKEAGESDKGDKLSEDSPSSLLSLIKHDGGAAGPKIAKRNEYGLFGDCSKAGNMFLTLSYNISVLGSPKIGKSCLCARYLNKTSGTDEANVWARSFSLPHRRNLKLKATEGDLPKDESDNGANYTKAHAVLLCYDITDRASFDVLKGAIKEVKEHTIPGAVLMVVGLRYDEKDCVDVSGIEGKAFADENGVLFRECSAADGLGVSGVFTKILHELQRIDGFALPIREEEANNTLPLSVDPVDGKKDREEEGSTESLLGKILSERGYKKESNDYDYIFKILLIGEPGSGKSSLLLRFTDDTKTGKHIPTVGVNSKEKTFLHPSGYVVKLQIWDIWNLERLRSVGVNPYRGVQGIIFCYDTTNMESFNNLKTHLGDADRYACENVDKLIVGTKIDLTDQKVVDTATALDFANMLEIPYAECSAKAGVGVDEAFETIVDDILERITSHLL